MRAYRLDLLTGNESDSKLMVSRDVNCDLTRSGGS